MKNILYLHAGAELYGADIVLLELLKNINKINEQVKLIVASIIDFHLWIQYRPYESIKTKLVFLNIWTTKLIIIKKTVKEGKTYLSPIHQIINGLSTEARIKVEKYNIE